MASLYSRITRRLRLRDLEALVSLEQTRSMTRTADLLAMTQPALSKLLKEIEASVGEALFMRTTRHVVPTEAGLVLLQYAQRILGDLKRIDVDLKALHAGDFQVVRVGAPAAVAATLLPMAVSVTRRENLSHQIRLTEGTVDVMFDKMQRREIDLLLARADDSLLDAGCHFEGLYDDSFCIAAAASHPLQGRSGIGWRDALEFPWIIPPEHSQVRKSMELALAAEGLTKPRATLVSTSPFVNALIAQTAPFLYLTSSRVVERMSSSLQISALDLDVFSGSSRVGVFWLDTPIPAARSLIDALKAQTALLDA